MTRSHQSPKGNWNSINVRKGSTLALMGMALFACAMERAQSKSQAKDPNYQVSLTQAVAGSLPLRSGATKDATMFGEIWQGRYHNLPIHNKAVSVLCSRNTVVKITDDERAGLEVSPPSKIYRQIKLQPSVIYTLPALDSRASRREKTGKKMQVGSVRSISLNPLTHSRCFDLATAGHAAIMAVVSKGARQIRVRFIKTALPDGAKLFVYALNNPGDIHGPYENRGPSGSGDFWSPPMGGDGVVIEYYSPHSSIRFRKEPPPFRIEEVSHVF